MKHLIDKDALVAEIKKLEKIYCYDNKTNSGLIAISVFENINNVINNFEVKEVDLEKEIQQHIKDCLNIKFPTTDIKMIAKDVEYTARKFFELGLQSTLTEEDTKLVWNLGDEIPAMSEEEFFKELLRRYKAQKGE